ncbi:MAG: arylsulfatase [Phycisphaeraceae bacterium]|nr:arylsulfatase [Phycisphaeraceae bacterium]
MARGTAMGLLAVTLLMVIGAPAIAQDRPPNIVLVMADDLGLHELGCYGQEKIATPSIDALASRGMRFTRAYSGSTVCAPSRCALMTGYHTGHAEIRGNREVGGWGPEDGEGQWPLSDEAVTLAEVLKARGYATGAFGKWGLGGPGSSGHPCFQGFDHFYGYLCQRIAHNYYPTHLWRNHDVDVQHDNRYFPAHQRMQDKPLTAEGALDEDEFEMFRGAQYSPTEILNEATGWMRAVRRDSPGAPLFVYFPSTIPHAALQAPAEWVRRFPREWDPAPYLGDRGYLPTARPHATYAAMIAYLDYSVGQLVRTLEEMGELDNTLFIFTSDNGTTFNGGVDREFFGSVAGLRGFKTNLYEGGIRVPLIIAWPGVAEPGECDVRTYLPDLFATCAEAGGARTPGAIDGRSLMAWLRAGAGRGPVHHFLYFEFPEGNQQQAIIAGDLKLIRPNLRQHPERIELYDLAADPGETQDLAGDRPEDVARLTELMRTARTRSEVFAIPALDEE